MARIAIAYSLGRGYRLDPATDLQDSKGKEYEDDVLLGRQGSLYIALMCGRHLPD